jgi:trans-aconitate methyltransferase
MQFTAPAEHYDRFMGRYVPRLAVALADAAGIEAGMRALDVGCGPGGLTAELASRLGADHVAAIDPAEQFAGACRERNPGADVRVGGARSSPGATASSTPRSPRSSSPSCATRRRARARWPG